MRGRLATEAHTVHFARNALFTLDGVQGLEIRLFGGAVWLTQEGLPRDLVLQGGEALRFAREGKVVIQVLRETRIAFTRERATERPRPASRPNF